MESPMKRLVLLASLPLLSLGALARTNPVIDADRLPIGEARFRLLYEGREDGCWTYRFDRDDRRFVITEKTNWLSGSSTETGRITLEGESQGLQSLEVRGAFAGSVFEATVERVEGGLRGEVRQAASGREPSVLPVDLQVEGPVLERTAFFWLLSGADLEAGEGFSFDWFNVFSGRLEAVTAQVGEAARVEVPAGAFDTLPVTLQPEGQGNVLHFTRDLPHRLIRVDVSGQPMRFERLAEGQEAAGDCAL